MQRFCKLLALSVAVLPSGCGLISNGARNLVNEPWLAKEDFIQARQARSLAREAWDRQASQAGASADFRDGYLDGYADYLLGGRTTDPLPAPPKRYLKITYQTPATLQAIEDYFAGFHAGAVDAQASGQRQRMVVPIVLPVNPETDTAHPAQLPPGPPAEPLAPPRPATTDRPAGR